MTIEEMKADKDRIELKINSLIESLMLEYKMFDCTLTIEDSVKMGDTVVRYPKIKIQLKL